MKGFITDRQVFMILYCIISGYSIINLPQIVAKSAGTGGWISLLITTAMFALFIYIITYLQFVHEGKTIFEYSQQLIGKTLAYALIIIYAAYYFVFLTMVVRVYCETIRLTILTKTPVIYLCLAVYLVVAYALLNGLSVIARLCEIIGLISIISITVISTILLTQGEIVNIRPLFVTNNIGIYLKAVMKLFLPFLGAEIMLVIPINRYLNKNIFKYTVLSIAFIGILFIYIVETAFSVEGISLLINSEASLYSVPKGIDIQYLEFFRRLDGIYIVVWIMNVFCVASILGYGTITSISKVFKGIKYKFIVIAAIATAFTASQLPPNMSLVKSIMEMNSYLGCIVVFIIPCILFLITRVKKYDKNLS